MSQTAPKITYGWKIPELILQDYFNSGLADQLAIDSSAQQTWGYNRVLPDNWEFIYLPSENHWLLTLRQINEQNMVKISANLNKLGHIPSILRACQINSGPVFSVYNNYW